MYRGRFFSETECTAFLPLPAGEGRGEGGCELVHAANFSHPPAKGEGTKNLSQKRRGGERENAE